jgi:predicted alpha/beta superfamily hydrolase
MIPLTANRIVMRISYVLKAFLIIIIGNISINAHGQAYLDGIKKYGLHSKATGQDYELYVSLPPHYKQQDTTRYPIIYVLDGNFMFPVMNVAYRALNEVDEVNHVILVGIGYKGVKSIMQSMANRTPDYTPTADTSFDNMLTRELKINIRSGGANKFLKALKDEIIPFTEKNLRVSTRGLAGHSFGALFGAYVLFHEPTLFRNYILSSISMPWDKNIMLEQEKAFYEAGNKSLDARLFVTVGDAETGFDMIGSMQKLNTAIRDHYKGVQLEERILPNETHASAYIAAFTQGLRTLFPQPVKH